MYTLTNRKERYKVRYWLSLWPILFDVVIGIVSFGFIKTDLMFNTMKWYLDNYEV